MKIINTEGFENELYKQFEKHLGDSKLVSLLIKVGVDVNRVTESGWTYLTSAAYFGHYLTCDEIINAGADVNQLGNEDISALLFATDRGHFEIVKLLIKAGADVNLPDKRGITPLMRASGRGFFNIVKLLIDAGADVNRKSYNRWSSLMFAEFDRPQAHNEIIELLKQHGARG